VSFSVYFVSQGQITQPSTVTFGQGVNEKNVSLLYGGELADGRYDDLSPVEENERLGNTEEVCSRRQT
jgi:hypothetical protein